MKTILTLLALFPAMVSADDELPFSVAYVDSGGAEILILHPEVGVTIDPPERTRYGLFRDAVNFRGARYVRLPGGNYAFRLELLDDHGNSVVNEEPTSEDVLLYVYRKIVDSLATETEQMTVSVVVDSVGDEAVAQLTKALNPVVSPHATRLTLAPTGRTLPAGQGYFADHWIFFPSLAYAASDHLALWGGFSLLPGTPIEDQLYYFGTKTRLHKSSSFNLAAGALFLAQKEIDDRLGAVYGVGTLGGPDASLTMLVGYGFAGTDLADRPLVVYGGEKRVGRRTFFIAEVLFYSDVPVFPFFGLRRYSEDGASNWTVGYPMLGYTIGFGG